MEWALLGFGLADLGFGTIIIRTKDKVPTDRFQDFLRILVGGAILAFGVYTIIAALTGLPSFMKDY